VFLSEGSLGGTTVQGGLLIGAACLAWGIDNNLSQRLSLRNPLQISLLKALGASVPMLLLAMGLGQRFPAGPTLWAALAIGAVGYGLSIWLDLLALRELGAAREAVVFATAPFVGVVFAVLVLREAFTIPQALASLLMVVGVGVLLRDDHSHRHHHAALRHAHRHHHGPAGGDPHHSHDHRAEDLPLQGGREPYWHAHEHLHEPIDHEHPHVSDAHHRHRHRHG
jgi:drug/metabolite transporter (DMT)-like permease